MNLSFFKQYLGNTRTVGAVAPSSRYLATKMIADIDFRSARVIVEYGPGTGVFTDMIAQRIHPNCRLVAIESNPAFYTALADKYRDDGRVLVVQDSAEHVAKILETHGLRAPDYIVSGLPFAALPPDVSEAILHTTAEILSETGSFITFQYTRLKLPLFRHYFSSVKTNFELRNIPPAWVVTCGQQK